MEGCGCPADKDGDEFAGAEGAGGLEAGCRGEVRNDSVVAGVGVGGDDAADGGMAGISGSDAGSSSGEAGSSVNSSGTSGDGCSDGSAGWKGSQIEAARGVGDEGSG